MTNDKINWPTDAEVRASFPPPRYRLVGYDIGTAPDENGGWVHWTDHEAEIARLTAERDAARADAEAWARKCAAADEMLDAMLAGSVKVKPLVWAPYDASTHHYNGPTGRLMHTRATCAGLDYSLEREEHPASEFYGKWFVMRGLTLRLAGPLPTDISAKDWCQADYEARIRAALQPDPDARQADLAKAWMMGRDAVADEAHGFWIDSGDRTVELSDYIRTLTPPADMVAKIGGAK